MLFKLDSRPKLATDSKSISDDHTSFLCNKIKLLLSLPLAHAVTFFGSQWLQSASCGGPPQSMVVFSAADPNSYELPDNETWPTMYYSFAPVYPYGYCGSTYASIVPNQCCLNSLDLTLSDGYVSGMMVEVTDILKLNEYASKEANGATYCHLKPDTSLDVLGYHELYLLNDDSCNEFHYRCHKNMTLSVYSEKQCQGEMIHYTLTKTPQSLVDDFLGSFTGTEVTFQQGQSAVGWVYNLPSALQVPRFTNGWEYLAIVGFIWSIAAFVYSFVYSLRKFLKSRTITMIMMMVSNFILLAWICIRIGYIYTIFLDDATFYTVSDAEKIMLNLGTLSVSFYTAKFLGTVRSYTSKENLALFFGLFLFHITFAGYQYFVPFIKVGRGSFMESWDMISYWWIIIWFIWDMLPIFAILYRMVESTGAQTLLERVKVVFETDKIFIATVFAQVFNTVLYFVIVYLQDSTTILGSDFVFTAFACYKAVCISVHSVLNAYMIERMRSIMKSINKTIGTKTLGTDSAVKSQIKNTSTVASSVPIVKK